MMVEPQVRIRPKEADTYTIENLFHFLHQLTAIIWLGGLLALNVAQVRLGTRDRAASGPLLHLTDLYGRAVIAPMAFVNLITGIVLVVQMDDVDWSDLWVWWGIGGIAFSLVLGATLIRATNAALRRLAMEGAVDDPQWRDRHRRIAVLYTVNLLVLLSAVWAMVFKPTL
jgi:putative copper export protein